MQRNARQSVIFKNTALQVVIVLIAVVFFANINAIVDYFVHPEIPYFDREHIIVGAITGLVSGVLFSLALIYARRLEKAFDEIRLLKSILPICSQCKKIRITDSDDTHEEVWQSIEAYISEQTETRFSHGICPECSKLLYPEYTGQDNGPAK